MNDVVIGKKLPSRVHTQLTEEQSMNLVTVVAIVLTAVVAYCILIILSLLSSGIMYIRLIAKRLPSLGLNVY
jgi:hypothetical protein